MLVLLLLMLLLMPSVSWATNYYFASTGSSDSNPCTQAQPCATMNKAETLTLQAGDQLLLKRGSTFSGVSAAQLIIPWATGTAAQPITIGTYDSGARPILDGGASGLSGSHGMQCDSGKQHLRIEGIRITSWLKGLWIHGCSNITVSDVEVDTIAGECVHIRNFSQNVTVQNSVVHDCGVTQNGEGFYIGTDVSQDGGVPDVTQNITLQGNEIYNTEEGIECKSGTRNCTILDNHVHDSVIGGFGGGILLTGTHANASGVNSNHLIRGNRVTGLTGAFGRGIYCRTGCKIHQNIVDNNSQAGIYVEVSASGTPAYPVELFNNTIVGNTGAAIQIVGSPSVTNTNNLAWANGSGNAAQDPRFVNQAGGDFRLCTGTDAPAAGCTVASPAIDTGSNVGLPFNGVAPDLGALETPTPPDFVTALRMHLKFDEGADTTAEDSTANNHDGTLGSGVDWGAAQMGNFAAVFDGADANSVVTVSGLLTSPAAITLAAWVKPAAFPTTDAGIISLGDRAFLQVRSTGIDGYYYTGSTYVNLPATATMTAGVWRHLAYTATAGAQRLYLDGALVASGNNAAAISYSGGGANTILGQHGNAGTSRRFQGTLDDVRVYTRALSALDVAGLADLTDPPVLAVLITNPTTGATYSTASAQLLTMGGVASDDTGVTGITWSCPTCVTTSGTATCTPACGAATTFTNWSVPSITLSAGTNLITATASDAGGTKTDTLTVVYTPTPAGELPACTHYASPSGTGNGLSQGSPFQVANFWALASAGKTLCLLDGTYTGGNAMITPPAGLSGSPGMPITVRALNDGAVLLDGENARIPVSLALTNSWYLLAGLNARNGTTAVYSLLGDNNLGQRLIGWNGTSGQANSRIFTLRGLNSVIEDCAGWGDNARVILGGSDSTTATGGGYRRCFCEWNDHPTGTLVSGKCLLSGKAQTYENIIGTVNQTGD